jgi:hypothetical protein
MDGGASTDFQLRNGTAGGFLREIVNGKLGAVVDGAACMFSSTQLWKSLSAIGGPSSRTVVPCLMGKGQPGQFTWYSVSAVPGMLNSMTIVDSQRSL